MRWNFQACRNNLVQQLEHLLFYGADMNARNASGNTPLHVCAVNNTDSSCIRQLLFRGAQKDALNYANQTPYQVAVIAGNMQLADIIKNYQPEEVGEYQNAEMSTTSLRVQSISTKYFIKIRHFFFLCNLKIERNKNVLLIFHIFSRRKEIHKNNICN